MKKMWMTVLLGAAMIGAQGMAYAGDVSAGKAKAAQCASCHGKNGNAQNPEWPNLAGQNEQYLIQQLKAFKEGKRNNPLMSPMAKGLSEKDIANLAAYYNSLGCQ